MGTSTGVNSVAVPDCIAFFTLQNESLFSYKYVMRKISGSILVPVASLDHSNRGIQLEKAELFLLNSFGFGSMMTTLQFLFLNLPMDIIQCVDCSAFLHTHTHTLTHARTHARTHMHTHTHAHTHTHTTL